MGVSLTFRLSAIFFSLLLVFWTVFVAYFYLRNDLSPEAVNPTPDRLAAMSQVMDGAAGANRDAMIASLNSAFLEVKLLSPAQAEAADKPEEMLADAISEPYLARLGDKLVHVERSYSGIALRPRDAFWDNVRPGVLSRPARALTFWVMLTDRSVLVVRSLVPVVVTPFGLPAGMAPGLIGTIFACIAFVLFHREVYPLKKLADAVEKIDPAGELVTLPKSRATTPEIRTLRAAFERLQTRLRSLTRARMALIGGIQHDLRTFATRLRLRVEALPDEDERERAIADIGDMIGLLDNALLTTRAGFGALDQQMLDLPDWLAAQVSDMASGGLDVTLDRPEVQGEMTILADLLALRRILTNLVENAVKYGKSARVCLRRDDDFAVVLVDDMGPGFNPETIDMLMEPFVRDEPSRARKTGGAGLGLAVARSLAEAHGGTIELSNLATGGRAAVKLPLYLS